MNPLLDELKKVQTTRVFGRVSGVKGLRVEVAGVSDFLHVGARLDIQGRLGATVPCEVVGFDGRAAVCLPFGAIDGVGIGCKAHVAEGDMSVAPTAGWLGRVVNGLGEPIDGKGPLPMGFSRALLRGHPPPAHTRARVGEKLDLGVRALNTFVTCCRGQRMGIFAGSGVGKSVLLSMLARYTEADVNVIGLIGERGREVQEFLQDSLGPDGLAKSILVVATSDEPALLRRQAAYMTMALAEHFRDAGSQVLCLIDSLTRFAMAQREIGLAGGEPPTTKGYPPTVFAELPKLLERAGPGAAGQGAVTGLFTVLVEGGDMDEPVADAVRGILDGHIILDRAIAERGRYPAIDVLRSLSRTMPDCNELWETGLITRARRLMATHKDMEELIRIGAYQRGTNEEVDEAIFYQPKLEAFLHQSKDDPTSIADGFEALQNILDMPTVDENLATDNAA